MAWTSLGGIPMTRRVAVSPWPAAVLAALLGAAWLSAAAPPGKPSPRAGHWPQWRGTDRLNLSPDQGLLKAWPKGGPPLAWQVNGIGQGVGPAVVAAGNVYVLGHRDGFEHLT